MMYLMYSIIKIHYVFKMSIYFIKVLDRVKPVRYDTAA